MMKNFQKITLATMMMASLVFPAYAGQKSGIIEIVRPASAKIYNIPKTDATGEARDRYVANKVAEIIVPHIHRRGRFTDFGFKSSVKGAVFIKYNGIDDALEFSWKWREALNYNNISANFGMKFTEVGDHYEVLVECPKSLVQEVRDLSITGIPEWNIKSIIEDISYTCDMVTSN